MNTITVEAIFENGVLRPVHPLALRSNQKVTLTLQVPDEERPWPENVAEIYKESEEEDRRLAGAMFRDVQKTWPRYEEGS